MSLLDFLKEPAYPKAEYPTIIEGYVHGSALRLESLTLDEVTIDDKIMRVYPNTLVDFPGVTWDGKGFTLKNAGPFKRNGLMLGVSHQQKHSDCGWLRVDPDCYHRWWFWRLQQQGVDGSWLPGTERGLYFRKPLSWRWDVAGTQGKHWIWTKGFVGGHWD